MKLWEIRGLFGNEFAMERAIEELRKMNGIEFVVLDRRNLSVRLKKRDSKLEEVVKRIIEISHGYVESEAPLGEYDKLREEMRRKKIEELKRKKGKH